MEQYGAHIVATTRRAELTTVAQQSRLAAAARECSDHQLPALVLRRRTWTRRAAAA